MTLVGAFMMGCKRSVALTSASLAAVKDFKTASVHMHEYLFPSHWSNQQIVKRYGSLAGGYGTGGRS